MSTISRADLVTNLTTLFADNTTNDITPEMLREFCQNIVDSAVIKVTDTNLTGLLTYDATRDYVTGEITYYGGSLYVANTDITAEAFDATHWDLVGNQIYKASVTVTTAELLALYATPKTIVAAVTGKKIQVISSSFTSDVGVGEAAYVGDTSLILKTDTATMHQHFCVDFLLGTDSRTIKGSENSDSPGVADTMLIENKALKLSPPSANPTVGQYDIVVNVTYILL